MTSLQALAYLLKICHLFVFLITETFLLFSPVMLCDQRYMEVWTVEEERPFDWRALSVSLVQQFEQSCSDVHWNPHDDALRHT